MNRSVKEGEEGKKDSVELDFFNRASDAGCAEEEAVGASLGASGRMKSAGKSGVMSAPFWMRKPLSRWESSASVLEEEAMTREEWRVGSSPKSDEFEGDLVSEAIKGEAWIRLRIDCPST